VARQQRQRSAAATALTAVPPKPLDVTPDGGRTGIRGSVKAPSTQSVVRGVVRPSSLHGGIHVSRPTLDPKRSTRQRRPYGTRWPTRRSDGGVVSVQPGRRPIRVLFGGLDPTSASLRQPGPAPTRSSFKPFVYLPPSRPDRPRSPFDSGHRSTSVPRAPRGRCGTRRGKGVGRYHSTMHGPLGQHRLPAGGWPTWARPPCRRRPDAPACPRRPHTGGCSMRSADSRRV